MSLMKVFKFYTPARRRDFATIYAPLLVFIRDYEKYNLTYNIIHDETITMEIMKSPHIKGFLKRNYTRTGMLSILDFFEQNFGFRESKKIQNSAVKFMNEGPRTVEIIEKEIDKTKKEMNEIWRKIDTPSIEYAKLIIEKSEELRILDEELVKEKTGMYKGMYKI